MSYRKHINVSCSYHAQSPYFHHEWVHEWLRTFLELRDVEALAAAAVKLPAVVCALYMPLGRQEPLQQISQRVRGCS